jgi:hypothetical protein
MTSNTLELNLNIDSLDNNFKVEKIPEEEIIAKSDFEKARGNIVDIIQIGSSAVKELAYLANVSQSPEHYEILSKLIKDLSDTSNKLMETHIQMEKINNKKMKKEGDNNFNLFLTTSQISAALKNIEGSINEKS